MTGRRHATAVSKETARDYAGKCGELSEQQSDQRLKQLLHVANVRIMVQLRPEKIREILRRRLPLVLAEDPAQLGGGDYFPTRRTSLFYEGKGYILCGRSDDVAGDIAAARCSARKQRSSALFLEISPYNVLGHDVLCYPASRRKALIPRRKALSHLLAISSDPDFVAGAKEALARKPFDYDGRRNDKSQVRYENGRLIAIRILQASFCLLVMAALWVSQAFAQQTWWALSRSAPIDPDFLLDTCDPHGRLPSPGALYDNSKTLWQSPEIVDKGDEVDVIYNYHGSMIQSRYFRTAGILPERRPNQYRCRQR